MMTLAPGAIETIRSYRGLGYDLGSALADLIDNSITAKARTIKIRFHWNDPGSSVTLLDDGNGMTAEALTRAMRMGADPEAVRDPSDLGRFGLGLKTASWSQCNCLTVCSKTEGQSQAIARWDAAHIEKVGDWDLLNTVRSSATHHLETMAGRDHGTLVLWEDLHFPAIDAGLSAKRFWEQVSLAERHLGMVFHRYLERRQLTIILNDNVVAPFDPMLASNSNRVATPEENLWLNGQPVKFAGFVMPPKNRLTPQELDDGAGPRGWLEGQGFYVYRVDRIVIAGGWLGLGRNGRPWPVDHQHELARISLDVPNTMDGAWQLSISKQGAVPPEGIRERLLKLAQTVRRRAQAMSAGERAEGRPKPISDTPWSVTGDGAALQYSVNRKHALVQQAAANSNDGGVSLRSLLDLLDKTAPMQPVGAPVDMALDQEPQVSEDEQLLSLIPVVWTSFCRPKGLTLQDLRARLSALPQFKSHLDLIEIGIARLKDSGDGQ